MSNKIAQMEVFIKVYDNEVINNSGSNEKRYYFKLNGIDCYWTEEENHDGTTGIMDWLLNHVRGTSWELEYAAMYNIFIDGRQIYGGFYGTDGLVEGDELTLYYGDFDKGKEEIVPDLAERIHYD